MEIIEKLRKQIEQFRPKLEVKELGYVLQVGDGIARVYGLDNVMYGELVEFPNGIYGMVLNLERDNVGCVLFGKDELIKEGDEVKRTNRLMETFVGEELLGRVINPLCEPLDGGGPIKTKKTRPIERIAPGVAERAPVKTPLQTGIKAIDSMIPIGRGQRELIIGDRQTGKTAIVIDTIINQRNEENPPICIYISIGQKCSTLAEVIKTLQSYNAMDYTIIIATTSDDPAPLQYLAPYVGCAIGEEFLENGKDVLCIYDDLSKHAQVYRQLSLLLRRPPGREAYPGDIFYLHSRLLERACKLSDERGGGSLTALPIAETQAGDITSYIPTNLISITDGQIYLESGLFYSGIRPAINVGLSVSRVGGNAQIPAMRKVAGKLRLNIAQYNELAAFKQFSGELDEATRAFLARGERMVEILKQPQYQPLPIEKQITLIYAGVNGYIDDVDVSALRNFEHELYQFIEKNYPEIYEQIRTKRDIDEELKKKLDEAIKEFKKDFLSKKEGVS